MKEVRKLIFAHAVYLEEMRSQFVCEVHQVKFKVTRAERSKIHIPVM